MDQNPRDHADAHGSFCVLGYRLVWMFAGPMAAGVVAVSIVFAGTGWLTRLDLLFLVAVLVTIAARWASFLSGDATDGDGKPTITPARLRTYTLSVLGLAGVAWVLANSLGNHFLSNG